MTTRARVIVFAALVGVSGLGAGWYFTRPWNVDSRACDSGDDRACLRNAVRHEHGVGVARDLPMARTYYERAYAARVWPEVTNAAAEALAPLLEGGRGGPVDAARALDLYDEVCRWDAAHQREFSTACVRASQIRARGPIR